MGEIPMPDETLQTNETFLQVTRYSRAVNGVAMIHASEWNIGRIR